MRSDRAGTAPHRTPLGTSGWELWRDAALASAGFPASRMTAICDAGLAAAADELRAGSATARSRYEAAYAGARERLGAAIRETASEPRFREAVAWQKPVLLVDCLDQAAAGKLAGHRRRTGELVIARRLQQYCLSNETLGFFGPVGWARISPDSTWLDARPGSGPLARRTTYFESWAIDALGAAIAARPEVLPWLTPRVAPVAVPDGRVLRLPFREPIELSISEARILSLCDGQRTVRMLTGDPADPEMLAALLRLRELGAVQVGLDVPISAWPELELEDRIRRIADPAVRRGALEPVAELVAARDAVSAAAGDADRVYRAAGALAEVFERTTGVSAASRSWADYSGPQAVYEDTVRDVEVLIGSQLTDALAAPLGLLLDSAAWLVNTVAARYLELCRRIVGRTSAGHGTRRVPLPQLAVMAMPELFLPSDGREPPTVADAVAEFQERWRRILAIPPGTRHYRVASHLITEQVAREFATGPALWSGASRHSADLMIAADGTDAIARGEFQFVLGKLHLATNSLENRVFAAQHPAPSRLLAAAESDHLDGRVYAIPKRNSPVVSSRLYPPSALLSPRYTYLCLGSESVAPPGQARVLPAVDLLIAPRGDDLVARCGRDGREYDFLAVIGEMLSALVAPAFRPLDAAGYNPRVSIDNLVLARESWTFPPAAAGWAFIKDERRQYAAARQWRTVHGLPERAFVRVPLEGKPIALDFRSIALVGLVADALQRAAKRGGGNFTLTEMMPDTDQLWLRDGDGHRYTAELKLVAVNNQVSGRDSGASPGQAHPPGPPRRPGPG
jgi:hypothetical protein